MLTPSSASDACDGFSSPTAAPRDASFLRQRLAALTRTVDEREATIASLMRQLRCARNEPSQLASVGRVAAGVAHQASVPMGRIFDSMRAIRRGFDAIDQACVGVAARDNQELHQTRTAMPGLIDGVLDDFDRIATLLRALENVSPVDSGAPASSAMR